MQLLSSFFPKNSIILENKKPLLLQGVLQENATFSTMPPLKSTPIIRIEERKPSKTFSWDEREQGLVLGAFFWLHWTTQIPGGVLAQKYGTKLVYGLSNFTGVLCCFIMPLAAYMGYQYLIFLRVLQGILAVSETFLDNLVF